MKTIFMNHSRLKALFIVGVTLFAFMQISCGGGAKQADTNSEDSSKEKVIENVINYPIPTAFEVIEMLNKAGASYILSLNNPVENVDNYFTEKDKALNLGVYGADLSYASTYEMKQETMSYLKVTKKLIDDLQISTAFSKDFAQKVEDNINDKDELINIITNSFYDTYNYLVNEGKDNQSLLVMTGSWVEGLYITTQIAVISNDSSNFYTIIANQKEPLNILFDLMKAAEDESIVEIMEMLKPLKVVFEEIEGGSITQDQFDRIEKAITEIRTKIIS